MIDLMWTRAKLSQWGRFCRAVGIGYPKIAAHESLHLGKGVFGDIGLPDDLQAIDHLVAVAPPQHKLILVEHYTKGGTPQEKAAHLGLKRPNYYRRKDLAEIHICREFA